MKISRRQLRQMILEQMSMDDEPMPHEKHPSDVAIDLGSVLPPLAIKKRNSGEMTPQQFEELQQAYRLVRQFLDSFPRF
tara:strand:- start:47 stop:283 length:237 start_codon:yes stop_codon:yes gene_type:complete